MNIKDFEKKYSDKGGINKLTQHRALMEPQAYIAEYFGVSKERVRQWMKEFFGSAYDKRKDRQNVIMDSMIDFAKKNGLGDFETAYKGSPYYDLALKEIKKLK